MSQLRAVHQVRLGLLLAGVVTAVGTGLVAQQAKPYRLMLAETAKLLPKRLLSVAGALPPHITAAEYSLAYACHTLVPAMCASVAVGDIDGDGHSDLYIVDPGGVNALWRNVGSGKFHDVTAAAGVGGPGGSLSATFSDYDRSGHPSLFVVGATGIVLYRNRGRGLFVDETRKAGLSGKPGELCTSAALADIDNDGLPDLLVTMYTNLNQPPPKPAFVFPNDFTGATSRLYRNNGDGTFLDVTTSAGLGSNSGRARKAMFADFNNDKRPDVLILRDDKPPVLYLNRGGGKFEDATWNAGAALTRHAFFDGVVVDLNRDDNVDVVLWSTQSFRALLNNGNAVFEAVASIPLLAPSLNPFGFHGTAADLDENGFDDVMTLDIEGRVHAFANHLGIFQAASLELPSGLENSYLLPFRLTESSSVQFLAVHSGGRVSLLGVRHDGK